MVNQLAAPVYADVRPLNPFLASLMGRTRRKVYCIVNGKGGVGKSSLAANLAVDLSRRGKRVLLAELDPQGNNPQDLGFERDPDLYDDGRAQTEAILRGAPLNATGEARDRLWVVPGGEHLEEVITELYCQLRIAETTGDHSWLAMYAAAIERVADQYDFIILDVAPGSRVLQLQAMVAADMVLVPCRSDESSRKGLRTVARRFSEARRFNPQLRLLGIVLFGVGHRATKVKEAITADLERDVRGSAPVFHTAIRYVENAAKACRTAGMVPAELAEEPGLDTSLRTSLGRLGDDYRKLGTEVMTATAGLIRQDSQVAARQVS